MFQRRNSQWVLFCLIFLTLVVTLTDSKKRKWGNVKFYGPHRTTKKAGYRFTKTICLQLDNTLRARRKSCFLRPDTGPCRADIIQWYFDVKEKKCYRFFWGGCQGNGNRFDTKTQCLEHCHINTTSPPAQIPYFCSLAFDYGTCFGHYYRWAWDSFYKTCQRRLYSGCGGNQNNFESRAECLNNCLVPPNNTINSFHQFTTCVPFDIADLQK